MSYIEYAGRTVDLYAFSGTLPSGGVPLAMSLAAPGTSGQIVTGSIKLAQRFVLLLMTEKGSIPHLPEEGTELMIALRSGHLRNATDVYAEFSAAVSDIEEQLRAFETEDMPADERFESAAITALTVRRDTVNMTVQINSQAGDSRSVILPLSVSL